MIRHRLLYFPDQAESDAARDASEAQENSGVGNPDEVGDCHTKEVDDAFSASRGGSESHENSGIGNPDEGGDCHTEEVDDDFSATRGGSETHENSDLTDPTSDSAKTLPNLESLMGEVEHQEEVLRDAGAALMTLERQPLNIDLDLESSRGKVCTFVNNFYLGILRSLQF